MKSQPAVIQPASARPASASPQPYAPVALDDASVGIEAAVSGAVLFSMLGFICMLFIGCFDAGLIA